MIEALLHFLHDLVDAEARGSLAWGILLERGQELRHDFTRELSDGRLDRFSVSTYDAATQLMHMRLFYERYDRSGSFENRRVHDLTIRIANRDELLLMLRLAGFETEEIYGGFEGEPFSAASDHLLALARKRS